MRIALLAAALSLVPPVAAQTRSIALLDTGWRFLRDDPAEADSVRFDDRSWQTVRLPHDWSIAGPVDPRNPAGQGGGFFPTGVAWYRRTLNLPARSAGRKVFIAFDGVMANSDVFCNGKLLGHRPNGYVSFHYDLTDCLHPGSNILAVRTDTAKQPASRWYTGSGIDRHVRLVTVSRTHIAPWGVFVTTPGEVTRGTAMVHIRATVQNEAASAAQLSLAITLVRPDGSPVQKRSAGSPVQKRSDGSPADKRLHSPSASVPPGATTDLDAEMPVPAPQLWDLDHPWLYTARVVLLKDGRPVDDETVRFGIRQFRFDPGEGFFLNGVHRKIKGVALHADMGALGMAVPLAAWQHRLSALRALGVNAVRTAHNPPAPEFLDLCDRMGLLVMDEMFDAWTVAKNPYDYHLYFRDWSLRDTADTVRRDRNHPSIILYSAGNEIHDTPHPEIAIPILQSLVDTFHANDPTRPVTQALFRPNASRDYDDGLADLLDVVGQNYREPEILAAHAQKPTRAILGTENGHGAEQWVALRDHREYAGQFLWTGADYLGEAGHWPSIGSGSGLLLTTSVPRARAFERQSWWSGRPMVRLARRVAPALRTPTDPGYEAPNQPAATRFTQPLKLDWTPSDPQPHREDVEVYTNADEVELTLNGTSLGTEERHADATPIRFSVPFAPGELHAIARTAGFAVAEDTLRTAGPPARLMLTTDRLEASPSPTRPTIEPIWDDLACVQVRLEDEHGTLISNDTASVHFSVSGPSAIVAVDNGNLLDHGPFEASDRRLYEGRALAWVRATGPPGTIKVTATAAGLPPASLTIQVVPPSHREQPRSF